MAYSLSRLIEHSLCVIAHSILTSRYVNAALEEGPQRITRRNDAVALISEDEYRTLRGEKVSFVDYMTSAKDLNDIDLPRSQDFARDVEL